MSVGVARQWNTWDAKDPLAFVHLPSGLTLRFSAFSSAHGHYRLLGQGPGVVLMDHESDGRFVRARIAHAGAELELVYAKPDPHRVLARLRVLRLGEWGLRFWIACELGFQKSRGRAAAVAAGRTLGRRREHCADAARKTAPPHRAPPLAVRLGPVRDARRLRRRLSRDRDFRRRSRCARIFHPAARRGGRALGRVALQCADASRGPSSRSRSRRTGRRRKRRAAQALRAAPPSARHEEDASARAAVRDVIAWNTLWDSANHRPTTVLTRNWLNAKFSGWGVWLNDMLFHALLAGVIGDFATARANLEAALEYQSAEGNLACLRTAGGGMDRPFPVADRRLRAVAAL